MIKWNTFSNDKICLDPLTQLPWNLISLVRTIPLTKSFTLGPSGYLPNQMLKLIFFLTSKYRKYLHLWFSHNSSICCLTSINMNQINKIPFLSSLNYFLECGSKLNKFNIKFLWWPVIPRDETINVRVLFIHYWS